ncbi:MAG TPA: glycosyltransferase family 4 protein [Thermoanaerobaculia bacterium]|nr:glycosyltransferase family 4 protein [Thermoanaerobaculia bacterium]
MKPRRLLFVVGRGRLDASSHKRVFDLLPFFRRLGYRAKVMNVQWEALWRWRLATELGSRPSRIWLCLLNATRMSTLLGRLQEAVAERRFSRLTRWADTVIVNQTALVPRWHEILRARSCRLVYDFDDAVWLTRVDAFETMLAASDLAVAGNQFLADRARRDHPCVAVIPTGVRLDRHEKNPDRRPATGAFEIGAFEIGWIGSPTTVDHLGMLTGPLTELARRRPVRLWIVGAGAARIPDFPGVELEVQRRIPYDPIPWVAGFHVGVMPLPDSEWTRGKCGAKALEYMAAGIPPVCSPVGETPQIVEHGVSGLLAADPAAWVEALDLLARDPDLRARLGAAARERVRALYSTERVVERWHAVLNPAVPAQV